MNRFPQRIGFVFKDKYIKWAVVLLASCFALGCQADSAPVPDIFEVPTVYQVGKKPSAIVAQDMNVDGYPDLLVTNTDDHSLFYFEGLGNGSFKEPEIMETGREPVAMVARDFNGDQIPDIAVCNYGDDDISIILGQKDQMFKIKDRVKVGRLPIAITAGDFNNDNKTDLAVTLRFDKLIILLGIGDGRFKVAEAYKANGTPSHVVSGDFNGDQNLDLAVAFNAVKANFIRVFFGNGDGTFDTPVKFPGGHQSSFIAVHDINLDNQLDLIVASFVSDSLTLFAGDGKGDFQRLPDFAGEKGPEQIAVGEFTGDRFPDLAVSNRRDGTISILQGRGDGSFIFPHINYPLGNQPRSLTAADFNRDGQMDLAVVLYQAKMISVFMRSTRSTDPPEF